MPQEQVDETERICQEFKRNKNKKKKKKELKKKSGWGIIRKQVFLMVAGRNPNPCI